MINYPTSHGFNAFNGFQIFHNIDQFYDQLPDELKQAIPKEHPQIHELIKFYQGQIAKLNKTVLKMIQS
jgi:hypothetical protein